MQIPQYKVFRTVQKQRFWPCKVLLRSQKSWGFCQRHLILRKSTKITVYPHTPHSVFGRWDLADFGPKYSCQGTSGVPNAFLSTQLIRKHFPRACNTPRSLPGRHRARKPSIWSQSRHFGGLGPRPVMTTRLRTVMVLSILNN